MIRAFGGRIWFLDDDASADEVLATEDFVTIEDLLRLCRSDSVSVRSFCAMRLDVPAYMLTEMSDDPNLDVRRAVAYNINTPPDVIYKLSFDSNETVRWCVAQNKKAPPDLLLQLALDSSPLISDAAQNNPNSPVIVKMWLQSGRYGGMSLSEYLTALGVL